MSLIRPDTIPVVVLAFANEYSEQGFLRSLTREMKSLLQVLEPAVQQGRAFIKLLPAATQEDIAAVFQDEWYQGRICIFHYAGHADEDELWLESDQTGNQSFFSLGLAKFLGAQQGLRLVCLNGCATAEHGRLLREANVPAVVTTSRKIDDTKATAFATVFFQGLAGGASVQEAFQEAEGILLGQYGPEPFRPGDATRSLFWDEEGATGPQPDLDLPWRLTLRKEANWVPAQWRLFYDLQQEEAKQASVVASDLVGESCGNYELSELLGQGTMGAVYRARHVSLKVDRAIKITHRVTEGYDHLKGLVFMGNKGLSTIDHPNVVEFYDVGEVELLGEKRLYVVMELISGTRLDKMDPSTFWTTNEDLQRLREVMLQLFSGLQAAHETQFEDVAGVRHQGIIHGNIKTRKILFTPEGTPKLIDFLFTDLTRSPGIKFDWPEEVRQKVRDENPEAFLAPELIAGDHGPTVQTDVYALGAAFFEVITQKAATQIKFDSYGPLQDFVNTHNQHIPRKLVRILWQTLHPRTQSRYPDAASVVRDLLKSMPWYRRIWYQVKAWVS
jgi:hypothetical protein